MSTFLSGEELQQALSKIMGQRAVKCAVAFWGNGSEKLLQGTNAKVICNLKLGGTNPFVLEKLVDVEIRQHDLLHAKVYIGHDQAIVTSANSSANGLGFEGSEQSSWLEAGVRVESLEPVNRWFDELWESSRVVTRNDLEIAKQVWRDRRQNKPTLYSFRDFDENAENANGLPLLAWIGDTDWELCSENINEQLGTYNEEIERRIDHGLQVEDERDLPIMKERWVLCWQCKKNGLPYKRRKLYWVHLSDVVVRGAFRDADDDTAEPIDVILGSEKLPPWPFEPTEPKFLAAFTTVLAGEKFKAFREINDPSGAWFADRQDLIHPFWADLKAEYLTRPS